MAGSGGMLDALHRVWFAESSLTRLAAFRILILALAVMDFVAYSHVTFTDAAAVSSGVGLRPWNPIYLFDVLGLQPIDMPTARLVLAIAVGAACLGIVGLFTRTACLVTALCCLYWTGLAYSFGKAHHDKVALAFALLALPLGPVGARLSLDALIHRFRRSRAGADPAAVPATSEFAILPIRLTQVTVATGYFFSGATKLAVSGPGWANGYTLMAIMMGHDNTWSRTFSSDVLFCQVLGAVTLTVQTTFPIVFLFPRLLWFYLPAVIGFHIGTWQTMDTGPYITLWFTVICFLPLERIPAWIREHPVRGWLSVVPPAALVLYVFGMVLSPWLALCLVPPIWSLGVYLHRGAPLTLLYDGGCGLCRRTVSLLLALDWAGVVEALDLRAWELLHQRFPELDRSACLANMHVVSATGGVTAGFAAYRTLAWRLPLLAPLAWLAYVPPVNAIGSGLYRRIADRRHRADCGDGACSIH